jgi:hypothetical protein
MHERSKREKKIAQTIISQSVEKEFETGLKEAEAIFEEWKIGRQRKFS